jgi:xanthine dehydrogenase accessory factor
MDFVGQVLTALEYEEYVFLATITNVVGSAPAPVLSRMLLSRHGTVLAGTLGGGCTENDIRQAAVDLGTGGRASVVSFGLSEEHVELGPVCGGTIEVLIEPLTRADRGVFESLKDTIDRGTDALLATGLSEQGTVFLRTVIQEGHAADPFFSSAPPDVGLRVADYREGTGARRWKVAEGEVIFQPFRGRPDAVIFGGGHVGQSIAHLAAFVGFRVTVIDDRMQFARADRFPTADCTHALSFDRSFDAIRVTRSTYIVIVTRGHQYDEMVLREALNTQAKYIGMIGSRRKVEVTFRHLREQGVPESRLRNVYTPIGLDIRASTVEEIAVSIVAEMILIRRGGSSPVAHKKWC